MLKWTHWGELNIFSIIFTIPLSSFFLSTVVLSKSHHHWMLAHDTATATTSEWEMKLGAAKKKLAAPIFECVFKKEMKFINFSLFSTDDDDVARPIQLDSLLARAITFLISTDNNEPKPTSRRARELIFLSTHIHRIMLERVGGFSITLATVNLLKNISLNGVFYWWQLIYLNKMLKSVSLTWTSSSILSIPTQRRDLSPVIDFTSPNDHFLISHSRRHHSQSRSLDSLKPLRLSSARYYLGTRIM